MVDERRTKGGDDPDGVAPSEPIDRLVGMPVVDTDGLDVGRVSDLYVATRDGALRYLGITTSWFDDEQALVPVEEVRLVRSGAGRIEVPYDREQLRTAPALAGG